MSRPAVKSVRFPEPAHSGAVRVSKAKPLRAQESVADRPTAAHDQPATGTPARRNPAAFRRTCVIFVAPLLLVPLGACRATDSRAAGLRSNDPAVRIRAIKLAGDRGDRTALPLLVNQLDDDDSAVRFYAILAMDKITGTRLGYNYADPPAERARAVKRWRNYLRNTTEAASQPTSAVTTREADAP